MVGQLFFTLESPPQLTAAAGTYTYACHWTLGGGAAAEVLVDVYISFVKHSFQL
jgi:hypothetical protein